MAQGTPFTHCFPGAVAPDGGLPLIRSLVELQGARFDRKSIGTIPSHGPLGHTAGDFDPFLKWQMAVERVSGPLVSPP